jgi:hypothetical protein
MMSSSDSPSVVWLEIWKIEPLASEPSPNRPRTTMPSWFTARTTFSIWLEITSAGRCIMAEARIAVPRLVGHAVR